jgi:hypothetical protein
MAEQMAQVMRRHDLQHIRFVGILGIRHCREVEKRVKMLIK